MKRWKNYGLWVSVFAFLPMLLEAVGIKMLPTNYNELVKTLLGILVVAGILNNPTDGKWFLDSKKDEKPTE